MEQSQHVTVRYLHHSGFWLENAKTCFLMDYSGGELPPCPAGKDLIILVSHSHGDHFHPKIFSYGEKYAGTQYILADEVPVIREERAVHPSRIHRMAPDTRLVIGGEENPVQICTLRSTDLGVAYLFENQGQTFYHAGDLHWWYWEGEPEADNQAMTQRFQAEVEKLKNIKIDVAFLPLDPRQEKNYALGLDYYVMHVEMKVIFPMHFWEQYDIIPKLKREACAKTYQEKIMTITKKGECYEI